jgi:predicted phosphoadenosine phosphosulfate sulfurtransferase
VTSKTSKKRKILRSRHKVGAGRDVLEMALERTRETFETFSDVVVSFSGGKDSTVILGLARIVAREMGRLPLSVCFFDEEAVDANTLAYVEQVAADPDFDFRWTCLPVKHRNACSRRQPYWHPWDPDEREKWIRPLPDHPGVEACVPDAPLPRTHRAEFRVSVPEMCTSVAYNSAEPWALKSGSRAYFMGLRGEESFRRAKFMLRREEMNYLSSTKNGVARSNTIYDWRVGDVWKFIGDHGLPYSKNYDLQRLAGISPPRQRIAHPFGEEPLESLWLWRVCDADKWDRIMARVPGANAAADWGRSALYGKRKAHLLYPGWEEDPQAALKEAINGWPEEHRGPISKAVAAAIQAHGDWTNEPVPLEKPGKSGVSWANLIALAHRGDFKGRVAEQIRSNRFISNVCLDPSNR